MFFNLSVQENKDFAMMRPRKSKVIKSGIIRFFIFLVTIHDKLFIISYAIILQ
jgi:hypothetical protein